MKPCSPFALRGAATRSTLAAAGLVLAAGAARAQSAQIVGVQLFTDEFYTTDAADFLGGYTPSPTVPEPIRALDLDATATTLWGVNRDTLEYGFFDQPTRTFVPQGLLTGPTEGVTGLTAAIDGSTWYLSEYDDVADESRLWVGDVTTGSFSLVGVITSSIIIDIAIDSLDNLYGHHIGDDSLYSIDTDTGAGTLIGPTGQPANNAQGMDFDWTDDTLLAALCQGGGLGGVFASIDVATGNATVLQDISSLSPQIEMAVQVAGLSPVAFCFGDGSGTPCPCSNGGAADSGCANGTFASGARLRANGNYEAVNLRITHGTPNQSVLFFEGTAALNGGNGAAFGDGLRCAGGSVIRLRTQQMNANGAVTLDGTVQDNGGGGAPGDSRAYQGWYRDPQLSPCGSGFNLTNGVRIDY